jgi:hypothetical protein
MTNWLEKLAKALPIEQVYKDLAQPAFRELGNATKNTVKAARFVIAPLDYLAAQQDRWQRWLKRLSEKVPEENLVAAHPQLSGPVIEGLRYLEEDSLIAELFLNLLARAIDKDRANEAHPAFAKIISQLSPDEALIIYFLREKRYLLEQYAKYNRETNLFGSRETRDNQFPLNKLVFPQNFFLYMDHLHSLNLAGIWQHGNQEPDMNDGAQIGVIITSYSQLTAFGQLFATACVPNDINDYIAK